MSTHPATSLRPGVTRSPGYDTDFAVACAREVAGETTIKFLLTLIVDVAEDTYLWRRGDGYGGGIHHWLDEIADTRGLAAPARTPDAKPRPISGKQRRRVFERNAYRCVNCGGYDDLTIDHIVALTNGGSDDDANLQTLCRRCNSSKGNR